MTSDRRAGRDARGSLPATVRRLAAAISRPDGPAGRRAGEPGGGAGLADRGFAWLTVLPAVLLISWLVTGLPLLLAGVFDPVPVLLIAAPLATALAVYLLYRDRAGWQSGPGRAARQDRWASRAALAGTALVAAGYLGWELATNSPAVLATRPPGVFVQAGFWIAQHGTLPIPGGYGVLGGPHLAVHLSSVGFFARGDSVVPGVLPGLPMLLAAGFWAGGLAGGAAVSPVLAALAVLSFGGLVGRLAGRGWAPAGALALAVTLPEIYTGRSAFSETAAQILLFGGMSLVADAVGCPAASRLPVPTVAVIGGLALGLASLLSLGSLVYLVPVLGVTVILIAARPPAGIALGAGLAAGCCYGLAAGYLLARPAADSLAPALTEIGLAAAGVAIVTVGLALALRTDRAGGAIRRALAGRPLRWLPEASAVLVVLAVAGLAARPYFQTMRAAPGRPWAGYVASLQRLTGLPAAPGRTYSEHALYWLIWYAGIAAVLLGTFGAALLARRCVRALVTWRDETGAVPALALPVAVGLAGAAVVLWQPLTVPDQPWASRRLVPVVLPAVLWMAIWAARWLAALAASRGAGRATAAAVSVLCAGAILLPAAGTSFGVGLTHAGAGGALRPSAGGLAQHAVGAGQEQAVRAACAALGPRSAVLIVDRRVAGYLTQVIRGMCGVPVGWLPTGTGRVSVAAVLAAIRRSGYRPVLVGAAPGQVAGYGSRPRLMFDLRTTQQPHWLTQPPGAPWPARYVVWMAVPPGTAQGA